MEDIKSFFTWSQTTTAMIFIVLGILVDHLFLSRRARRLTEEAQKVLKAFKLLKQERDDLKELAESQKALAAAEKRYSTELKRKLTVTLKEKEELKQEVRKFKDVTEILLQENERFSNELVDLKMAVRELQAK